MNCFLVTQLAFRFLVLCLLLFSCVPAAVCRNSCIDEERLLASGVPESSLAVSKAYLSPTVFQGTLLSVLVERDGTMRTTFGVHKMLKSDSSMSADLKHVEVVFFQRHRGEMGCVLQHANEKDLKLGSQYIVFGGPSLQGSDFSVVTANAFPKEYDKKTLRQILKVLCKDCAKPPGIEGLGDVRIRERRKLRLRCHLSGNPIPWVKWYRNGKLIANTHRIKVRTKRKSSRLVIRHVRRQDSGVYECRAGNVVQSEFVTARANVTVMKKNATKLLSPETKSTVSNLWPTESCPNSEFCLNGGTCIFYRDVGEYVCHCAEGYVGLRCDYKDVRLSLSKIRQMARDNGQLFVTVVVIVTILFCINWATQIVCWICWVKRYNTGYSLPKYVYDDEM